MLTTEIPRSVKLGLPSCEQKFLERKNITRETKKLLLYVQYYVSVRSGVVV